MTLEELIADKEKNFYVSDAMKESIKELYDRLPKKEIPEQVGTTVDEAYQEHLTSDKIGG
jgi:GTPase Era involved in 16S rRNA processing